MDASPELILVSDAAAAAAAREALADPEPLDAWIARMRRAESERAGDARTAPAPLPVRQREERWGRVAALAFAAACAIASLLPALQVAFRG